VQVDADDLEAGAVMVLEHAGHQVGHGVLAEVGRQVADAQAPAAGRARRQRRRRGQALAQRAGLRLGAAQQLGARGAGVRQHGPTGHARARVVDLRQRLGKGLPARANRPHVASDS
jgi:hypothetical protein